MEVHLSVSSGYIGIEEGIIFHCLSCRICRRTHWHH